MDFSQIRPVQDVKDFHEGAWKKKFDFISDQIKAGVTDLGRMIYLLDHEDNTDGDEAASEFQIPNLPTDHRGNPLLMLTVLNGRYAYIPRNIRYDITETAVLRAIEPDTNIVLELGAGYARVLFRIYLRAARRNQIQWKMAELADWGRKSADLLASLEKGIQFSSHAFNHHEPNFDFIEGKPNVVVFTNHTIEQAPILKSEFFERLLERTNKCVGIHAEPVGWQQDGAIIKTASERLRAQKDLVYKINDGVLKENSALYSLLHRYNVNLLQLLDSLQEQNKIGLRYAHLDLWSDNPLAPVSIISWEKK